MTKMRSLSWYRLKVYTRCCIAPCCLTDCFLPQHTVHCYRNRYYGQNITFDIQNVEEWKDTRDDLLVNWKNYLYHARFCRQKQRSSFLSMIRDEFGLHYTPQHTQYLWNITSSHIAISLLRYYPFQRYHTWYVLKHEKIMPNKSSPTMPYILCACFLVVTRAASRRELTYSRPKKQQ